MVCSSFGLYDGKIRNEHVCFGKMATFLNNFFKFLQGMSGELKEDGIAVNALWPRTSISTAAVQNLLGKGIIVFLK